MLKKIFILLLLLTNTYLFASAPAHNKKVVGYFASWGIYGRDYLVKDIPCDKLTHINFAFVAPFYIEGTYKLNDTIAITNYKKSDGSAPTQPMYIVAVSTFSVNDTIYSVGLAIDDVFAFFQKTGFTRTYNTTAAYGWRDNIYESWDKPAWDGSSSATDRTAGLLGELHTMKKQNPHIKVLASIGGWSYSNYFADIANSSNSRTAFSNACNQFLNLFNTVFDGVDLDWEFPIAGGDSAVKHYTNDNTNLTALCSSIRSKIGSKLLTMATAQTYKEIPTQYEQALKDSLDFLCIMSYDYSGSWSPKTGIEAPLYPSNNTNDPLYQPTDGKYLVIDEAVKAFQAIGIPNSQLVLGVPFYGRTFGNVANANQGLFQNFSGSGPYSYEAGSIEFNDLVDKKILITKNGSSWTGNNGYTRYWDSTSKTPYLFNGSSFVSYDDTESITEKVNYAKAQNLGGVMIWELSSDTRSGSSVGSNILLTAIDTTFNSSNVKIDGYVTGLVAVKISLYNGTSTTTATTDSDGYYSFFVTKNQNYTITPSKINYSFAPTSRSIINITTDATAQNFTGTFTAATYSISGNIQPASANVLVTLSGDTSASVTTDASGSYSFSNIVARSTVTVTATKTNFIFEPKNYTFNNISANQTAQNFAINAKPDYNFTPLPAHVIVGYWQNWDNTSAPFINLENIKNTRYNVCIVSFIETASQDGYHPIFTPTQTSFKTKVQELKTAGIPVLISIGGQNGHVELKTTEQKDIFVKGVIDIIEEYGFDGLDIDYEGGSMIAFNPPSTSLEYAAISDPELKYGIDAIREIYNYFGEGFIITAAPEISYVQDGKTSYPSSGQFLPFIYNIRDILSFVHVQIYNYGASVWSSLYFPDNVWSYSVGPDAILAVTEMLLHGFPLANTGLTFPALRQDQVVIGLPASPNAAGTGFISKANVIKALNYITKGEKATDLTYKLQGGPYPNLRGAMTWSINWDATTDGGTTSYEYANYMYDYFNGIPIVLPDKYSLTGKVKNTLGNYLYPVKVELLNSSELLITETTTDTTGKYSFSGLLQGSYIIKASSATYSTKSIALNNVSADQTLADIILTPTAIKYTLSGKVVNSAGTGLANIPLSLRKNNLEIASLLTDAAGNYSFANIDANTDLILKVNNTSQYLGTSIYINTLDQNLMLSNIILEPILTKYTISGTVKNNTKSLLNNITLYLKKDGVLIQSVQTNTLGEYLFTDILANESYILEIPSQNFYLAQKVIIDNLQGNISENFLLQSSITQYQIKGKIQNNTSENLSGIIINLIKNNMIINTVASDTNGEFTFSQVTAENNYTVELKQTSLYSGQFFYINNLQENWKILATLNSKGRIKGYLKDKFSRAIADATLYITPTSKTTTLAIPDTKYVTLTDGSFNIEGLSKNVPYKIMISKTDYDFLPDYFIAYSADTNLTVNTSYTLASASKKLTIYPNPCYKKQYTKMIFANVKSTVALYDVRGLLVNKIEPTNEIAEWDLKNNSGAEVASGIYLVLINNEKTRKVAVI